MKAKFVAAVGLAGLIACAGPKGGGASDGFDLGKDTVHVLPMRPEEVYIDPLERFKDDFGVQAGTDPRAVMAALFDSVVVEGMNDTLKVKHFRSLPFAMATGTGFEVEKRVMQKKESLELRFRLPTREELAAKGMSCRFVMGVGSLELRHREGVEVAVGGLPGLVVKGSLGAMSEDYIDATFTYILWDHSRNEAVSYGIANGVPRKGTMKTAEVWGSTLRNAGVYVLKRMGLKSYFKHPPIQETPRYGY